MRKQNCTKSDEISRYYSLTVTLFSVTRTSMCELDMCFLLRYVIHGRWRS